MSRRVLPFGGPCHSGEEWTCLGCDRVICGRCDPSPGESETCADCYYTDDPGDAA